MTSWQLPLFRFFEPSGFRSEQYSNKIPLVRKKGGRNRDQTTLVAILIETAKLWWILSKTCFRFSKTKTLYKFEAFGWYHHCRSHARTSGKSWFWTTRWNTFLKSNFVFFWDCPYVGSRITKDWHPHQKLLFQWRCFDRNLDERCQNSSYGELRVR